MYDDTARKLAIQVIAKVESNNDYAAINYNDPITVGVVQWFGNRAAAILTRMRRENGGAWSGVAPSLNNDLLTRDSSETFWNSRYLTTGEGNSIIPVLSANKVIQDSQIVADCEVYKQQAITWGLDVDAHTDTTIFFFTMYHQSPQSSLEVLQANGTDDSLTNTYNNCLAHPVLGQYVGRYTEARDMIVAGYTGGDPLPPTPPADTPPVYPSDPGASSATNLGYIEVVGNSLILRRVTGDPITFHPDGHGRYMPRRGTVTAPPPVDPPPPVEPPPGTWVHPLPGSIITSPYGPRPGDGFHYGCDFSTPGNAGTLRAVTDMVITVATDAGEPSAGTYVKAHSTDGAYTFQYAHMVRGSLKVAAGQTVTTGTVLGTEGATGNAFGRHCHFEMYAGNHFDPWWTNTQTIDPVPVLRAHGVNL